MHPFIESKLPEIKQLFEQYDIKSAYLFGSAGTDGFGEKSDVDFLIEFGNRITDPAERGENWWSLYYALKELLQRDVDLLTMNSLSNPYLIDEINRTKRMIYAAAA